MTDAERLEDCGMCGLPYHRYCDHDPEHDWSPTACINALRAEVERLRGVVEAAKGLVEEWRKVSKALDYLDFPESPRAPADEKLIVAVAALAALEAKP